MLPVVAARMAIRSGDSTVSKVIALLDELKGKVQADLDAETSLMEEYSTWCKDEQTTTSYAIKDEVRRIGELQAAVEDASGKAEANGAAIAELGPAIAGKKSEHDEATNVRGETKKAFVAKEKELVEAEDMLRRAYSVLKNAMHNDHSFIQGGKAKKMEEVVAALGAVINAAWIDTASQKKLKAFMQEDGDDDELTLTPPQSASYNYESKSGNILQTIDDMRDKVVDNLRNARTAETKSVHGYELLSQSLNNEINVLSEQLEQAQAAKGAAEEAGGAAAGELKEVEGAKAADESYLATTTQNCNAKAAEWDARQKAAADEMATLDAAKDTLANGVKVFAQVKTSHQSSRDLERRARVVSLLKGLGRKFNSFGMLQAASSANADPFGKVRGMIQDMITKLEEQARAEADHEAMCREELAVNEKKKAKKIAALDKYNTRLDKATASIGQMKDEIVTLKQELKDLHAAVTEATRLRNEEHADNTKTIEDNKLSAAAVADAIKILREFYGGEEAFLQAKVPAPEFQAAKSDATHSIIGILETAESDFTKTFMETESAEEEASAAYKKFKQEAEVTKAKKEAMIVGKSSEIDSLGVQQNQNKDDIANTEKELEAVVATLATLHKECDNKSMSFEERKSRREAEIAGLQEALEILAADEGASFTQTGRRLFRK